MKVNKEILLSLLLEEYDESGPYVKLEEELYETSRWSIHYYMYFMDTKTNKCYRVPYSVGATESQCEEPWEYDNDEIECTEVKEVEKVVTVWEVVK